MKKRFIGILLGISLASLACLSHAQLGNIFGGIKKASGEESSGIPSGTVVKKFVEGTKNVMTADIHMLEALGLKEQADKEAVAVKNLTEGATVSGLEDAVKIQTESSKALSEKMSEKNVVLSSKSKALYTKGLVYLAKGAVNYNNLTTEVKNFQPSISSLDETTKSAVYIIKELPGSTTNLMNTLKRAVQFARDNNIEVPKDATSLL